MSDIPWRQGGRDNAPEPYPPVDGSIVADYAAAGGATLRGVCRWTDDDPDGHLLTGGGGRRLTGGGGDLLHGGAPVEVPWASVRRWLAISEIP